VLRRRRKRHYEEELDPCESDENVLRRCYYCLGFRF
jgi:hypothetical protein